MKGRGRNILLAVFAVAILIILFGVGLLQYDKVNIRNMTKDYEVYGTSTFEAYNFLGEDDTYFAVSWHGFYEAWDYAFPKEGVQGLKKSLIGKDVYLCGTKGEHIIYGDPVEIEPVIIEGKVCFPIKGSIEKVVRCYTEDAFLCIMVGATVMIIDVIAAIIILITGKKNQNVDSNQGI